MTLPDAQVHGIYHQRVGDRIVTAVTDGYLDAGLGIMTGIAEPQAAALQRAHFRADPPRLTINAFLIRGGDAAPMLVDTGSAANMGPGAGRLLANLAALGVDPASIGTILLTHLHVDHASGLIDAAGGAAFPNAEIVAHQAELDFWLSESNESEAPEAAKGAFALAQATTAPYRAAGRARGITGGEAAPGVSIHPLPGHTPGHSGWMVQSGGKSLLIWGDVVHMPGIQFANPDAGVMFDSDGPAAVATRKRAMDMAATDRVMVAGMHLDFPAFGHLARDSGAYRWIPEMWNGGL